MKAMILAAGFGMRLGDLTRDVPKGLLDVGGRPLLEHIILNLQRHGFNEIAVNLHFQPDMIRDYFGDGARWKVSLTWTHEPELMGTAGGLKRMESFLRRGEAFLVHYGDIVTDQDFTAMLALHRERSALATLLLHRRTVSNSIVHLDADGRVVRFIERPSETERRGVEAGWVNSGVCLCAPELLEHIPAGQPCDLPRDVYARLVSTRRLFGFPLTGYRCAIDSPDRLAEAAAAVATGRCRINLPPTLNGSN